MTEQEANSSGAEDLNLTAKEKLAEVEAQAAAVPRARQWQYLIFDLGDGDVTGTDDFEVAKAFAASEEHQVLQVSTCQLLNVLDDGTPEAHNIPESNAG